MYLSAEELEKAQRHFYKEYMYFSINDVYYLEIGTCDFENFHCDAFDSEEKIKKAIDQNPYGMTYPEKDQVIK